MIMITTVKMKIKMKLIMMGMKLMMTMMIMMMKMIIMMMMIIVIIMMKMMIITARFLASCESTVSVRISCKLQFSHKNH